MTRAEVEAMVGAVGRRYKRQSDAMKNVGKEPLDASAGTDGVPTIEELARSGNLPGFVTVK